MKREKTVTTIVTTIQAERTVLSEVIEETVFKQTLLGKITVDHEAANNRVKSDRSFYFRQNSKDLSIHEKIERRVNQDYGWGWKCAICNKIGQSTCEPMRYRLR